MAQRMESAAPPGGVMFSESTARLVQATTILGAPDHCTSRAPPYLCPTIVEDQHTWAAPAPAQCHHGVGGAVGTLAPSAACSTRSPTAPARWSPSRDPRGIGKTRLAREAEATAGERGVAVFSTDCESHSRDIAFRVVTLAAAGDNWCQ